MSDAPFGEKLVLRGADNPAASAARKRLQAALTKLDPAGGIPDTGDASGRHAKNVEKQSIKK